MEDEPAKLSFFQYHLHCLDLLAKSKEDGGKDLCDAAWFIYLRRNRGGMREREREVATTEQRDSSWSNGGVQCGTKERGLF